MDAVQHLAMRHGRCGNQPHRPQGPLALRTLGARALGAAVAWSLIAMSPAAGQQPVVGEQRVVVHVDTTLATALAQSAAQLSARTFHSATDSVEYETARAAAARSTEFRVVVSMFDRELYVLDGTDTLLVAPVAVAVDTTLAYNGKSWKFETPRGKRRVIGKAKNPVWTPPDWHYAEVAGRQGLKLAYLRAGRPTRLADGRQLTIRNNRVGTLDASGFWPLPVDEEIVFDGTIFVPPAGTRNRHIEGELGKFKLDLGNGYLLHGTPHTDSIGQAATHGCVRLLDEDIEWLYSEVPVGTAVYIY
jgi:hypothetical protein